jgi:hypothetical protein
VVTKENCMGSLKYKLYRSFEEIPVTVEFNYSPAQRGAREHGTGVPLEPDYEEEIEIISVKNNDGVEVKLHATEDDELIEACVQSIHGCREQSIIDHFISRQEEFQ